MKAGQLAAALEVSATPKPGNIHRNSDYLPTRFEHYLAGSISLGPSIREIAIQGYKSTFTDNKKVILSVGKYIKKAIFEIQSAHMGGNTHLGITMLFIPLAAAAAICLGRNRKIEVDSLQNECKQVLNGTTFEDTMDFFKAISALNVGWLGKTEGNDIPDFSSKNTLTKIDTEKIKFLDLLRRSAKWDGIASELSNGMHSSFKIGYPEFIKTYEDTLDINSSVVNSYLKILSEVPDTFIARKVGLRKTNNIEEAVQYGMTESIKVSTKAKKILQEHMGMKTLEGRRKIMILDKELKRSKGLLNPGTTADITASSLMIALLMDFKF
jgi:triphosphoribosyl-dephospho-CoA synthase